MSIWFGGFPLDDANNKGNDSLIGHLGIELVEAGAHVRSELSCRTLIINTLAASNSKLRAGRSPALEIRPARSTSPDW